ncbi:MAG: glycoside hydrolase family 13 protein [Bacteroidota bacterium]
MNDSPLFTLNPSLLTASAFLLAALLIPPTQAQEAPPVPSWAADAVWYQLFPERFRNGDPTNDPTFASLDFGQDLTTEEAWAVTPWTGDWYVQADWEQDISTFYDPAVFMRRYGGDLQGVIDHLDYLDSLGVNALYFNPVFHAPSLHKYDGASFHHIDPYFGPDPEGDLALMAEETADPATWSWTAADSLFLQMLGEAHARGIRVVIDGVFNHTGTRFYGFEDLVANQEASRYADWYEVTAFDNPDTPENEYDYNGWWGYKGLPVLRDSLNAEGEPVTLSAGPRQYVFDITRRWMDPNGDGDPSDGIDGWRLDVADEVPTGFWAEWNDLVFELNPEAYTVAETWHDAVDFLRASRFSAAMNYHAFAMPVEDWLMDGRIGPETFAEQLVGRRAPYSDARAFAMQNLIDSHDTERVASGIVNRALPIDFDQQPSPRYREAYDVRAPTEAERDIQRMIAVMQVVYVGAPMFYYGTEAGMWGADDPDDRKPMVWPDLTFADECTDPRGLERDCDPIAFDAELFAFYQDVIALRHEHAALRRGDFTVLAADSTSNTLVFQRLLPSEDGEEELVVAFNRSDARQKIELPDLRRSEVHPLVPIFASRGDLAAIPSLTITMTDAMAGTGTSGLSFALDVPARTAVVYRRLTDEDYD